MSSLPPVPLFNSSSRSQISSFATNAENCFDTLQGLIKQGKNEFAQQVFKSFLDYGNQKQQLKSARSHEKFFEDLLENKNYRGVLDITNESMRRAYAFGLIADALEVPFSPGHQGLQIALSVTINLTAPLSERVVVCPHPVPLADINSLMQTYKEEGRTELAEILGLLFKWKK